VTLAKAKQTSNKKTKVSVIIKMPFRSTSPTERERALLGKSKIVNGAHPDQPVNS
jgi:hypothetical protein